MSFISQIPQAIKYARGTVWWCKDESMRQTEVGVQHGTRPALIISSNERGSSRSVEVLKLTTAEKAGETCRGVNIPLLVNGVNNYVLCNQHFTVNVNSLTEFMCVIPEESMKEIEYGVLRAQGMPHLIERDIQYLNLKKVIQDLVDTRLSIYMKSAQESQSEISIITEVIQGINNLLKEVEGRLKNDNSGVHKKVLTEPYNRSLNKYNNKFGRLKWTAESAQELIEDRNTPPTSEVDKK